MDEKKSPFDDRWRALTAAARRAPEEPLPTLDVELILAARHRAGAPAALRVIRIGWFPPGLAAAAMLACGLSWLAGLDPRPALSDAGMFLADLPAQVPHAPMLSPPVAVPSPSVLTDLMPDTSFSLSMSTRSLFSETTP